MQNKTNQLKIGFSSLDKIKYYCAFSYLQFRPLFKSKLFEYFDYDIKRAFLADSEDIKKVAQYYDIQAPRDFVSKRDKLDIDECFKQAFLDEEVKILTFEDEKYPEILKEIPDFPLSLYYKGELENIDFSFNLAVVGSRQASQNALLALDSIISEFKNSNILIISGLAYGIDAQAHQSAIKNNLKTIAVVGCGLDTIYPNSNKNLFNNIKNGAGVIFSEYPLKTPPMPQNFPQRNRIVVGLSKGVLVAEARIKSGAMISANLALDYNRELMCIPGNILNPNTQGIYHLIKNGAGIVSCAEDLLNFMNWDFVLEQDTNLKNNLTEIQKEILEALLLEQKTFDEIINITNKDTAQVMITLTELELKGLIKQANNKYYKCK